MNASSSRETPFAFSADRTEWIADAGSTKTDWTCLGDNGQSLSVKTSGINPFMQEADGIVATLGEELRTALPQQSSLWQKASRVTFYGAGCRGEGISTMREALGKIFKGAEIEVVSDLTGAARALCQNSDGIACILGTGSNSGLFVDGEIRQNTPPLGFILGDEGSGASLGRRIIGDCLKGLLPDGLDESLRAFVKMDTEDIIHRVYRVAYPNRFLASLAPFLYQNRAHPVINELIVDEMTRFIRRNILVYQRPDLPICATGSIAFYFQKELRQAAQVCNFTVGNIVHTPMEGLVAWHRNRR